MQSVTTHVAAGFTPAFNYHQRSFLPVFERGHKARGYALIVLILLAINANAEGLPSRLVLGFQAAYALENNIPPNATNSHINMLYAQPQIGIAAWRSPESRLPLKQFDIISEGIIGGSLHPGGRMIGDTLLFRFEGKPIHAVLPFLDVGSGPLNTTINERASELGGHVQFLSSAGVGIQHKKYVVEYRYFHMSNAGLTKPNHGFNGSMLSVGLRWR
jgi:hypothetical protein